MPSPLALKLAEKLAYLRLMRPDATITLDYTAAVIDGELADLLAYLRHDAAACPGETIGYTGSGRIDTRHGICCSRVRALVASMTPEPEQVTT